MEPLMLAMEDQESAKQAARAYRSLDLSGSQLAHLELLMAGYYGPLRGYPSKAADARISRNLLALDPGGLSVPALEVPETLGVTLHAGERIALRDPEGILLAILTVSEVWPSKEPAASPASSSASEATPEAGMFVAGRIDGVEMPVHYDFPLLRLTSDELRRQYGRHGWRRVLACQPRRLIHRAEAARIAHAARLTQAGVLVQVLATEEQTVTLDHYTRVRCIEHSLRYLSDRGALMTLLPMPQLPDGAHEVIWRATLAHQAGATHLLVEPEWWNGVQASDRESARALLKQIGIEMIDLPRFAREANLGAFLPVAADQGDEGDSTTDDLVARIRSEADIPGWVSFPEVLAELRRSHPVRGRQGVTVFFTGLSGAGKSTIARVLLAKLLEIGERTVTLLDGDIVRKNLSSELGFSRQHRDLNILRIGFVASEITKHGGIAICAPIAPYRETRRRVRQMVAGQGGFFEIHVATPIETCELRDRKGLYAKARAGLIKEFTGISDPYETPERAELVVDTRDCTPLEAAQLIINQLQKEGFLLASHGTSEPSIDLSR